MHVTCCNLKGDWEEACSSSNGMLNCSFISINIKTWGVPALISKLIHDFHCQSHSSGIFWHVKQVSAPSISKSERSASWHFTSQSVSTIHQSYEKAWGSGSYEVHWTGSLTQELTMPPHCVLWHPRIYGTWHASMGSATGNSDTAISTTETSLYEYLKEFLHIPTENMSECIKA